MNGCTKGARSVTVLHAINRLRRGKPGLYSAVKRHETRCSGPIYRVEGD
jgi:hypothetical protein